MIGDTYGIEQVNKIRHYVVATLLSCTYLVLCSYKVCMNGTNGTFWCNYDILDESRRWSTSLLLT